jgi:hypothetical protein
MLQYDNLTKLSYKLIKRKQFLQFLAALTERIFFTEISPIDESFVMEISWSLS